MRQPLFACLVTLLLTAFCLQSAFAHGYKLGDLDIHHPWTRATPAGADVAGGYLDITNNGQTPDRLVSVEVVGVHMAMIHEMAMTDGVMTMRPLPNGLVVDPGETVTLKPGTFHVMMMGLSNPFSVGELVHARLTFEKAGTIEVDFKVDEMGANPSATHDHSKPATN